MHTSYFARSGTDPHAVAICNGTKGFHVRSYAPLIPPWWLVERFKSKEATAEEFTQLYQQQLAKLDPHIVVAQLGTQAILLCWEKPGEFCHRRLAAEWIESKTGVSCPELGHIHVEQTSLF